MARSARPPRPTRRAAALALVAVAALALSACAGSSSDASGGGSDGGGGNGTSGKTTSTTTSPIAAPAGKKATGAAVPSTGCGQVDGGQVTTKKVFLDDSDRWFLLTTPTDDDGKTPLPLVLDIHGLLETAEIQAQLSQLPAYGQANGFVVVEPNGTGNPQHWELEPNPKKNPDIEYLNALLDQVEATQCIDTSRIYSTGLSNGAMMSSLIGCTMADRVAAIAPISGLQRPKPCDSGRPVPVLTMHGTEDPILIFNGGANLDGVMPDANGNMTGPPKPPAADIDGPGYPEAAQAWADANGCESQPTDSDLTDTVIARVWDCPPDGATEFLIVRGGGHSWPGSEFTAKLPKVMGPTDDSIDANEVIWDFFQRFQLPQP